MAELDAAGQLAFYEKEAVKHLKKLAKTAGSSAASSTSLAPQLPQAGAAILPPALPVQEEPVVPLPPPLVEPVMAPDPLAQPKGAAKGKAKGKAVPKTEAKQASDCCANRRKGKTLGSCRSCCSFFRALRWPALLICGLAVVRGTDSTLNHLARAVGASADITVAASELAVRVINSTSSGFTVVSSLAWAMTSSSLGVFEASWSGVDLVDVSAWRTQGRLRAPSPETMAAWLGSTSARRVTACEDDRIHSAWTAGVQSLSAELTLAENSQDFLSTRGSFSRVSFAARLLDFGEVELRYEFLNASFAPQWANPIWALLEVDIDTQAVQIAGLLDSLVRQVPRADAVDYALSEEEAVAFGSSRLELRKRQALRALHLLGLLLLEFFRIYFHWLLRGCGLDFGWCFWVTLCLAAVFVGTFCLWLWNSITAHSMLCTG